MGFREVIGTHIYQVFPLPVLEHAQGLQGADNVVSVYRRLLAQV